MLLRYSLVLTNDAGLTKWEIHRADCPDVAKMFGTGAFVEVVSAKSAEHFVKSELTFANKAVPSQDSYTIMPCCPDATA